MKWQVKLATGILVNLYISLGVSWAKGKNIDLHILIPFAKKRTLLCFTAWMCVRVCHVWFWGHGWLLPPCGPCNLSGSSVHWTPGKNKYWVGCHALLQGSFLTQGLNPCWQAGSFTASVTWVSSLMRDTGLICIPILQILKHFIILLSSYTFGWIWMSRLSVVFQNFIGKSGLASFLAQGISPGMFPWTTEEKIWSD